MFGKKLNQKLLTVDAPNSLAHIEGYAGQINAVKRKGALNYFFTNGRYMRHPYFHKAVMQAYESLIPAGETPDYFIYFTLDPAAIDVNIHPTKTEIKFENERLIWQILVAAVRETLGKSNAMPGIDFNREGAIDIPAYHSGKESPPPPKIHVDHGYNPFHSDTSRRIHSERDWEKLYKGFEQEGIMQGNRQSTSAETLPSEMLPPETPSSGDGMPLFPDVVNPCFQYKGRYIITLLKSGLVIIDQRRAHVRILYDRFLVGMKLRKGASQQLLFPEIIEFTASEASMLPTLADEMRWLGFDLCPMGNNSYSLNGVPPDVKDQPPGKLVKEIVHTLTEQGDMSGERMQEILALSLAKATAIHSGKMLTVEEMETLVAALFSVEANNLTPDGKRIMSVLTDDELARRFKA